MSLSPAWTYVSLLMFWTVHPSASSAWKNIGTSAGTSKNALPSRSTETVPRHWRATCRMSYPMRGFPLTGVNFGMTCHTRSALTSRRVRDNAPYQLRLRRVGDNAPYRLRLRRVRDNAPYQLRRVGDNAPYQLRLRRVRDNAPYRLRRAGGGRRPADRSRRAVCRRRGSPCRWQDDV